MTDLISYAFPAGDNLASLRHFFRGISNNAGELDKSKLGRDVEFLFAQWDKSLIHSAEHFDHFVCALESSAKFNACCFLRVRIHFAFFVVARFSCGEENFGYDFGSSSPHSHNVLHRNEIETFIW